LEKSPGQKHGLLEHLAGGHLRADPLEDGSHGDPEREPGIRFGTADHHTGARSWAGIHSTHGSECSGNREKACLPVHLGSCHMWSNPGRPKVHSHLDDSP